MRPVPELTPRDWSPIKEGGRLVLVDCDRERNRANPDRVTPVNIAGRFYECIPVERLWTHGL